MDADESLPAVVARVAADLREWYPITPEFSLALAECVHRAVVEAADGAR
jgi:hypothetical protein